MYSACGKQLLRLQIIFWHEIPLTEHVLVLLWFMLSLARGNVGYPTGEKVRSIFIVYKKKISLEALVLVS